MIFFDVGVGQIRDPASSSTMVVHPTEDIGISCHPTIAPMRRMRWTVHYLKSVRLAGS